jgi:hypothetical protein
LVLWFSSCRYGVELRVMCPVCGPQTGHITLNNKICNKNHLLHLVGILFPHSNQSYNLWPPNDTYICRTAPLTSRHCIFIYLFNK